MEVVFTDASGYVNRIDTNFYQHTAGVNYDSTVQSAAAAAANPGPIPTENPILYPNKYYLVTWIGKQGQASIDYRFATLDYRDAALATIDHGLASGWFVMTLQTDGTGTEVVGS